MTIQNQQQYKFFYGTKKQLDRLIGLGLVNQNHLYYLTDKQQIYVGDKLYGSEFKVVDEFPPEPKINTLYIHKDTKEIRIFENNEYKVICLPVSQNLDVDYSLATSKAIREYIKNISDKNITGIEYRVENQSLNVLYGDGSTKNILLKEIITGVNYDSQTGNFEFSRANGEGIIINTPKENFLSDVKYDPYKNTITFTMVNGATFNVDLTDLIEIYTTEDTQSIDMNLSGNRIFANLKLSNKEDNRAKLDENGLYVPDTDLSNYSTSNEIISKIDEVFTPLQQEVDRLEIDKQNNLTAGLGIRIDNNVISSMFSSVEWGNIQGNILDQKDLQEQFSDLKNEIQSDMSNYQSELQGQIDTLSQQTTQNIQDVQNNLDTAESNLDKKISDLDDNTQSKIEQLNTTINTTKQELSQEISATKTEVENTIQPKLDELDQQLDTKQNVLTSENAGDGISIVDGVISNTRVSAEWGNIQGDISTQTDLQTALDGKQDKGDYALKSEIPTNNNQLTNGAGYITSDYHDNTKQNVISDLETIRSGASKGATALQSIPAEYVTEIELNAKGYLTSYTETDPIYATDKPNIALKSEIPTKTSQLTNDSDYITSEYHDSTKQDKLTAGDNITIINNVISGKGGSGLEVCDIGMALYVDETKGLRRYLNGQIVERNDNTEAFFTRLQEITTLHPSLLCTEEEWQTAKTMSAFGQVGKFVFNYDDISTYVVIKPLVDSYIKITPIDALDTLQVLPSGSTYCGTPTLSSDGTHIEVSIYRDTTFTISATGYKTTTITAVADDNNQFIGTVELEKDETNGGTESGGTESGGDNTEITGEQVIVSVRIPAIVNVQGLFDLQNLGLTVEAGLPNITGELITLPVNSASGALSINGTTSSNMAISAGSWDYTKVGLDASLSNSIYGNSDTVQPEAIQYPYFIQIATGQETENNIINDIELNNPYSFGDSKYSPIKLNNISWLKSEGQWNSKAIYPAFYDWLLKKRNEEFKQLFGWKKDNIFCWTDVETPQINDLVYGYGGNSKVIMGYVSAIDGSSITVKNTYTTNTTTGYVRDTSVDFFTYIIYKDGINVVTNSDITANYPSGYNHNFDYDFVLNTTDETFRLPLLDGSEDLLSAKYDNLTLLDSGSSYIAPANGWFNVSIAASGAGNYLSATTSTGIKQQSVAQSSGNKLTMLCPIIKGETITLSFNTTGAPEVFRFIYAQGNGSLYYYVGETVQNANLIDAGRIGEQLVGKADTDLTNTVPSTTFIQQSVSWGMPDYSAGVSIALNTTYTCPKAGFVLIHDARVYSGTCTFTLNGTSYNIAISGGNYYDTGFSIVPVAMNDTVKLNSGTIKFYPAKGAN